MQYDIYILFQVIKINILSQTPERIGDCIVRHNFYPVFRKQIRQIRIQSKRLLISLLGSPKRLAALRQLQIILLLLLQKRLPLLHEQLQALRKGGVTHAAEADIFAQRVYREAGIPHAYCLLHPLQVIALIVAPAAACPGHGRDHAGALIVAQRVRRDAVFFAYFFNGHPESHLSCLL